MLRDLKTSGSTPFDDSEPSPLDEGGLRAPPNLKGWRKFWWWIDFLILVKLARLRFIAVLVVIGAIITQWDTLVAYYDRWTRHDSADAVGGSDVEYFCPMHPSVVRDNPRDKCPICFMPLAKRKKGESTAEALPAGVVSRVQLSPYRVVLAGVNTWKVSYQPLMKDIEAIGYIEFNERGQRTVSARVDGRIDELFINETGQLVNAGDKLASIYSPELFSTVQNLRIGNASQNRELIESTRTKLELLGVDNRQIDEVLQAGADETHLIIYSPIAGHVINKYVREGQYVKEGDALYDVADLSSVWVLAQIYEEDLAFLPLEQAHKNDPHDGTELSVVATTPALPNEEFQGKLSFIYPHVDQETRTVAVRFEIDNPGHKLRPGMTAKITLRVPPRDVSALKSLGEDAGNVLKNGHVLAVPESSVIDTGRQTIVYRQSSPGVFDGVQVRLGPQMNGPDDVVFYPVLRGLKEGEDVVTSGSFLVDAETRLNPAAGSIYFGGSSGSNEQGPQAQVRPSTPEDPEATVKAALAELPEGDRQIAEGQRFCPVRTNSLLGSMGRPFKLQIENQTVFLCCDACKAKALAHPRETIERARRTTKSDEAADREDAEIIAALEQLAPADRRLAEEQRFCAVLGESRLGSMGKPVKLQIGGQTLFLCCEGCTKQAQADPKKALAAAKRLRQRSR